jgi:uncharacterized protein (TIGR03067 family)
MLTEFREALPRLSTFKLLDTEPGQIDLTTVYQGNPVPLETQGIYALQGAILTYCIGSPGRPRPMEFATRKGDERTLVVLKRL